MIPSPSKSQLRGFIVIHTAVQKPEQVYTSSYESSIVKEEVTYVHEM